MNIEKLYNKITSNGNREIDEIRFLQGVTEYHHSRLQALREQARLIEKEIDNGNQAGAARETSILQSLIDRELK